MARLRKCRVCPDWHEIDEPWPQACMGHWRTNDKRSALPCPAVISDDLGTHGLMNHADGKVYTSKAEYVRAVKAAGCEILGSEKLPPRKPPPRGKLSDEMRREIRQRVQALDSPTRKLHERRRRING